MVKQALVLGDPMYGRPYELMGITCEYVDTHNTIPTPVQLEEADLVLFTGGSDISPALYGAYNTDSHTCPSRDLIEMGVYLYCLRNKKTMMGICRGSQFLRGASGGKLYQHIDDHGIGGEHAAYFAPFVRSLGGAAAPITITSTHHQAAMPDVSEVNFIDILFGESGDTHAVESWIHVDYDIAACQYHPEYMDEESEGMVFFQDLTRHLLGLDLVRYVIEL